MRVAAVITARGGSKGVPRKNVALLGGRSLLSYTAESALNSQRLDRIIVSTDDQEIAEEAKRCGLETPFIRPAKLARDDTPTLPVLQHAVRAMEETGDHYDAICLLQPTHPFRCGADIDRCIEMLETSDADAVMTVARVPDHYNPHWTYLKDSDSGLRLITGESTPIPRRQDLPTAYHREGSVYVTRHDVLMRKNSLYGERVLGCVVDAESRINIDSPQDLQQAQLVVSQRENGR